VGTTGSAHDAGQLVPTQHVHAVTGGLGQLPFAPGDSHPVTRKVQLDDAVLPDASATVKSTVYVPGSSPGTTALVPFSEMEPAVQASLGPPQPLCVSVRVTVVMVARDDQSGMGAPQLSCTPVTQSARASVMGGAVCLLQAEPRTLCVHACGAVGWVVATGGPAGMTAMLPMQVLVAPCQPVAVQL
jgi:hypothetical protein